MGLEQKVFMDLLIVCLCGMCSNCQIYNEIKAAISFTNQGIFNAYKYCLGVIDYLNLCNNDKNNNYRYQIYEHSRVQQISHSHPHEITTTDGGKIIANHVIIATHLPILDRSGHFASNKAKSSYCICVSLNDNKQIVQNGYISCNNEGHFNKSLRPVGENNEYMIVAGNGHTLGLPPNGNTQLEYDELIEFAKKYFSVKEVVASWSSHDYIPNDFLPYIGYLHYGTKSLYTTTGYKKWGFSQAASAGYILANLIVHGEDDKSIWHPFYKMFDARRWDLNKSIVNAIKMQAFVSKYFVKSAIEDSKLNHKLIDVEDLANDCGAICKSNGKVCGAYRDPQGNLHKVDITCGHLGCHVRWNQGDRTYDCPCHGSRYDYKGNILHGPTVHGLKQM
jgi:nitrite reductase/ring-hydroxylating ferredoxin subunit